LFEFFTDVLQIRCYTIVVCLSVCLSVWLSVVIIIDYRPSFTHNNTLFVTGCLSWQRPCGLCPSL